MRTYLFLAVFWLLAAGLVFGYPVYDPTAPRYTILGSEWSIGWLLLAFAAWQLIRWWSTWQKVDYPAKEQQPPSENKPKVP